MGTCAHIYLHTQVSSTSRVSLSHPRRCVSLRLANRRGLPSCDASDVNTVCTSHAPDRCEWKQCVIADLGVASSNTSPTHAPIASTLGTCTAWAPASPLLIEKPRHTLRVRVEIMGSKKCRIVGESQPVLIMINPMIFTRTREGRGLPHGSGVHAAAVADSTHAASWRTQPLGHAMKTPRTSHHGDRAPPPRAPPPPPIDAPCTQCLRHGDLMHAQERLTAPPPPPSGPTLSTRSPPARGSPTSAGSAQALKCTTVWSGATVGGSRGGGWLRR
jgi:hypothetical protein